MSKPEVARKPLIVQQPTALAPSSRGGVIFEHSQSNTDKGRIREVTGRSSVGRKTPTCAPKYYVKYTL